ncbi:MAG: hypothetical protein LBG27_11640 [Spirochaetaceae bacterium]|nr:hypothetical protein [Spirochaetaceae bacterium]
MLLSFFVPVTGPPLLSRCKRRSGHGQFHRVLRETKARYGFEIRGLRLEGARLTFCIKPDDGFMLMLIMQWLKQTFSLRFNIMVERRGHVCGERYESEILDGEGRLRGRRKLTGRRRKRLRRPRR